MSLNNRINKVENVMKEYLEGSHLKKRAFALMRKLSKIGESEPDNQDGLIETMNELIDHIGSDTIKHKMTSSAKRIEQNEESRAKS